MVQPDMAAPDMGNRPELNIKKSKTKKSITQRSKTHSFPPPAPSEPPAAPAAPVEGMKEILEKRAEIEDQIEYDLIANPCNRELWRRMGGIILRRRRVRGLGALVNDILRVGDAPIGPPQLTAEDVPSFLQLLDGVPDGLHAFFADGGQSPRRVE